MPVGTVKDLIGSEIDMRISHPARGCSGGQEIHCLIGRDRDGHIQQRHVDLLATSCPVALMNSCENCRRRIDASQNIGNRNAIFLRLSGRLAGQRRSAQTDD